MTICIDHGVPEIIVRPGIGAVFGSGATVPADGSLGWSHGSVFVLTSGSGATAALYINVAANGSGSNFDSITDLADQTFSADTISEFTAGSGVTVDGVLLKDGDVDLNGAGAILFDADGNTKIHSPSDDELDVTVDGNVVCTFDIQSLIMDADSVIVANTIAEKTPDAGVTIDSLLLKDGSAQFGALGAAYFNSDLSAFITGDGGTGLTFNLDGGNVLVGMDTAGVKANNIGEYSADAGVTIDSLLIKNGDIRRATATLAAAGADQAGAAAIVSPITFVSGADGSVGVRLPTAVAGLTHDVYNLHATAGLKIYPAENDDINDGATDAAITTEGKTLAHFVALDDTTWASIFTANT